MGSGHGKGTCHVLAGPEANPQCNLAKSCSAKEAFPKQALLYGCQPKNTGTPKWMVKIMEHPIKLDDLGGKHPYFWRATHIVTFLGGWKNTKTSPAGA